MPEEISQTDFAPVRVDLDTLNNSPASVQVRNAGNFTFEEKMYWNALDNLTNLNTFLTRDTDSARAKITFSQLEESTQKALLKLNPEAKYALPHKNFFQDFLDELAIVKFVKHPLRTLMEYSEKYVSILENAVLDVAHTAGAAVEIAKVGTSGDKQTLEQMIQISDKWKSGWNPYKKWNKSGTDKLDEEYNRAIGVLARGLIDGKNYADIFAEYGSIDNDMADAWTLVGTPEFKDIIERYSRHKISLGQKVTDFAGRFAPQKKNPTSIDLLKEVAAVALLGMGGIRDVKRNKYGEFVTEKFFHWGEYGDPSVGLDIALTMIVDPLTYMTFGGSTSLKVMKAARTAEELQKTTNAALRMERIGDLFKNSGFVAKHENFITDIKNYRKAISKKDLHAASAIRTKIALEHPEYDDDVVIDLLAKSTVKKGGKEVPITNIDTLKNWFEMGENINYIVNGKVNNIIYFRESSVALQSRLRMFKNGMRSKAAEIFQGLDKDFRVGNKLVDKDIIKEWTALEKAVLSPGLRGKSTPEDMLEEITKNEQILNAIANEKRYIKKDIRRAFGELLSRMPEQGAQIFWADALVDKSLNTFRSYARLITGDRMRAEYLTQLYKTSSVNDRINILFNLDRTWLDSIGASATYKGQELRDTILASRYMHDDYGSLTNFLDETSNLFDTFKDIPNLPYGPTQLFHTTEGITTLPFDSILAKVFDKLGSSIFTRTTAATKIKYPDSEKYKDFVKKLSYMYYAGSTHGSMSRAINQGFVFLLLFPKLGLKAAIDEATVLANISTPSMMLDFLGGKGRQLTNINTAITGSNKLQGPVKELLLNVIDRNPAKFKTSFERKQMQSMKTTEISFVDPKTGRKVTQLEKVTAEEFFGMSPDEMLVRAAIERYGKSLSKQEIEDTVEFYLQDSGVIDAMIGSSIAATFGNSMALDINLLKELYVKSPLTLALEANSRKILPKPYKDIHDKLSAADRSLAHYKYFYLLFAKNEKYGVNLSELFFNHNALATAEDIESFVNTAMKQWGWKIPYPNKNKAIGLNNRFGQVTELRKAGFSEEEISRIIIVTGAKEMRYIFHGGVGYNKKLWKLIRDKHFENISSIIRVEEISDKKVAQRLRAGVPEPISSAEKLRRKKLSEKKAKWSTVIGKLTQDEFNEAMEGFVFKGPIKTDIDFDEVVNLAKQDETIFDDSILKSYVRDTDGKLRPIGMLNTLASRTIRAGYQAMDRQVNDLIRSDVYHLKYLEERKKLRANEEIMVKYLIKNDVDPENAVVQASGAMANQAAHNAANGILKYIDNPALRSQLAFNMRVVGRFIRASEDFFKRVLRWTLRHPASIPWRIGHVGHASSGSGILYDDENGDKYVVIPNDGVFWQDIAPAIVMLMNPLYSVPMAGKATFDGVVNGKSILDSPYWNFFKQVDWNQYTMKVSALNPSYQENAGVYSLVGPNIALPVIGIRNLLLGKAVETESSGLYNFALGIDDLLLGVQSDDVSVLRATIPPALINFFKGIDGEYKDTQGYVATYQAMAMIQSNPKTAKSPKDFLNQLGELDTSKGQAFLDEIRIQVSNILAQKAAFNTIFGAPLSLGAPDLPDYLRKNGIVTLTKEYGDILRAVLKFNQEHGFQINDPYTVAVSMHAELRPGKLIFQVSKGLNESKVAINYTRETLTWAIANREFLKQYSTAGWIFAPNIGEYDPKVMKYMQAADLIPPDANPFDWNESMLKKYLEKTTVAKQMSEYYQYERDAEKLLNDPNNPSRNFSAYRKQVMDNVELQQKAMLDGNPLLKYVHGSRDFDYTEELREKFTELSNITLSKSYPKTVTKETQKLLETMVRSARELLLAEENEYISTQYLGNTFLEKQLETKYSEYAQIATQNAVLGEAWEAIIKPLLDKVYKTPFRTVRKPGE